MYTLPKKFLFLLSCCLLLLLAACGTSTTVTGTPASPSSATATVTTSVNGSGGQSTSTPVAKTLAVPPTQTSCPATGTARAMVTAPLVLGHDQTIVYSVNEGTYDAPTFGTLKRFDVVNGAKVEILKQAKVWVNQAQLSTDGQWILFMTSTSTQDKLQLERMDGQGLQTLYCAPRNQIGNVQWSSNQKWIVFDSFQSQSDHEFIYLLNTVTGELQSELSAPVNRVDQGYTVRTWLDNTHLYLTAVSIDQPPTDLYILDINKGAHQTPSDLLPIVKAPTKGSLVLIGDLDSSYDGRQLFIDHGVCEQGGCVAPSDITMQPALGGPQKTIFSSKQFDAISVRAIGAGKLLVVIANSSIGNRYDTSHNGLWIMNTDGSGMQRLVVAGSTTEVLLNSSSQYPWSNVSRDGKYYVAQVTNFQKQQNIYTLVFGTLTGGPSNAFVSLGDGVTTFNIIGWTTL